MTWVLGAIETDHPRDGELLSLWWAPLDLPTASLRDLADCLSPEELQRADQYHHRVDRERFLAARAWLRHLLADQLACAPGRVGITTGDGGKPTIVGSDLRFNSSRSAGVGLYVTSWRTEVGVDVEEIRESSDVKGIATRFFSPREQRALASLPAGDRLAASFQCWTRKEAYVKGIGVGLNFPLHTVDVWADHGRPTNVSGWVIHQVDVGFGFAAAVAGAGIGDWIPRTPRPLGSPNSVLAPSTIN